MLVEQPFWKKVKTIMGTSRQITSADQLVSGKEYVLVKRFRKTTAYFDEVVSEKAKPGEWTPQEAPYAAFPGILLGSEPAFKEDRQKLFDWLTKHGVKIYEL